MTSEELETLKYPIGKFNCPTDITKDIIDSWIAVLEDFPSRLEELVLPLIDWQLDTPYRPDGWTIRQVVHHLSDSHHNSYTRFKWALTENNPVIKAYYEDRWATLFDSKTAAINMSLYHLQAVHAKLVYLLRGLSEEELNKTFIHPETNAQVSLKRNIGVYAWHSNHHYAHIQQLLKRKNWI